MSRRCRIALCALAFACAEEDSERGPVRVFVAASAAAATREALEICGGPHPMAVVVEAASSALARQIAQGAPAQLFLAANPRWMDHLETTGFLVPHSRVDLLGNRLVVVAPRDAGTMLDPDSADAWAAELGEGRLALGDPTHVPAGMYAEEALRSLGVWAALEDRLAPAADARAALALVERGEVALGVVYASDAAGSERVDVVAVLAEHLHPTIRYPLAIMAGHGEGQGTRDLWTCLQSPAVLGVFEHRGFRRP